MTILKIACDSAGIYTVQEVTVRLSASVYLLSGSCDRQSVNAPVFLPLSTLTR